MDKRIGFIIPSLCDKLGNWKNVFIDKVIPGYKNVANVNNIDFLFNLQGYGDNIQFVIDKINSIKDINETWKVKYVVNERYNPVSMFKIREDTYNLCNNDYLYVILDDDVIFNNGAGECYNEIIKFFEEDPELGMVMSAGFLGGYKYVGKLRYDDCKWYWTNRGLFVRNTGDLYPDNTTGNFTGGYEDIFLAIELLSEGYKLATHFNNPSYHRSNNWKNHELGIDKSKLKQRDNEDCVNNPPCEELSNYLKNKFNYKGEIKKTEDFKKLMSIISKNIRN